ncbi:YlaH-like family protein [Tenuibacillus multivorans]|uniref:YlaH-like protein n=1 Tax=Tenuibacillus multivorans TaxID=237069 RepID=A0A1G9YB09_9BACI|nr:YlaH-like family protein [Tenuibacillus multivorans]GEL76022.1 putative membrane protein YlaH [Tenuibacillus multivorans]SDN06268.1 YlaH-like protein [Tenuibacillus multivorans]
MDENSQNLVDNQFKFRPIEEFFLIDIGGTQGFWFLYLTIVILAIITYKLGFAKRLPLMKSMIVYILLTLGCFILMPFALFNLPIVEVLIITSIVLGIYRFRLHRERDNHEDAE